MGLVLRLVETRADGGTRSIDVLGLGRPGNLRDIAGLGLTLPGAKRILARVQRAVVAAQARDHVALRPGCPGRGGRLTIDRSGVRSWAAHAPDPDRFRPIVAAPANLR
jgi:hypothetical protein